LFLIKGTGMNYIDITSTGVQEMQLNVNLDGTLAESTLIEWTITQEGNDDSLITIETPDGLNAVTDHGYYQTLTLDLYGAGITADMQDETQYTIEGSDQDGVIYRGKFLTTTQSLDAYSVNDDDYTENNSTNNFVILQ